MQSLNVQSLAQIYTKTTYEFMLMLIGLLYACVTIAVWKFLTLQDLRYYSKSWKLLPSRLRQYKSA